MLGEETDETGETGTLSRAPPRDGTFLEGFFFLLFAPQGHSTAHAAASGFVMEGGLFLLIAAGRPAGWIGSLIPACAAGDNVAVEIGSEGGRGSCCAVVASSTGTPVAFPRCVDDGVRTTLESDFGVSNLRGSSVSLFLCLSDGLRCHAAEYRTGFCCCCWTGGGRGVDRGGGGPGTLDSPSWAVRDPFIDNATPITPSSPIPSWQYHRSFGRLASMGHRERE